ncbi:MAG: hypothetical protein M3P01_00555 [Actinomycetota bacterium]|nr:hypothetical protein [Actinomycetota bacterium]
MDAKTRPLLSLVCPGCGVAFPSAMQMDPRTFEGIRISNLLECCSNCFRVSRFNKPDYLFRSLAELKVYSAEGAGQAGNRRGGLPFVRARTAR